MCKQQDNKPPIVACFSGHDPSGGAGIHADIEAINANCARACTLITALTVQDTHDVQQLIPVDLKLFRDATKSVLNDISVHAFKTGLLADAKIARSIVETVKHEIKTPLIVDPVLASGSGSTLSNNALLQVFQEELLPVATIATPNLPEAQALSGEKNADGCAEKILAMGCQYVLLTGTHAKTEHVVNTLYSPNDKTEYIVKRLSGDFHGSGCTLASSIAARLANGDDIKIAVSKALDYTWHTLKHAQPIGNGQLHPNRHYS